MELVDFLRARLDEDEAVARAASEPEEWMELNREQRPNWYVQYWADPDVAAIIADPESSAYPVVATPVGMDEKDAEVRVQHIARHDPARVLADVEAKRRIVDECAYWRQKLEQEAVAPSRFPQPGLGERLEVVDPILRALALPYADHPDYRDEWRPVS